MTLIVIFAIAASLILGFLCGYGYRASAWRQRRHARRHVMRKAIRHVRGY